MQVSFKHSIGDEVSFTLGQIGEGKTAKPGPVIGGAITHLMVDAGGKKHAKVSWDDGEPRNRWVDEGSLKT